MWKSAHVAARFSRQTSSQYFSRNQASLSSVGTELYWRNSEWPSRQYRPTSPSLRGPVEVDSILRAPYGREQRRHWRPNQTTGSRFMLKSNLKFSEGRFSIRDGAVGEPLGAAGIRPDSQKHRQGCSVNGLFIKLDGWSSIFWSCPARSINFFSIHQFRTFVLVTR